MKASHRRMLPVVVCLVVATAATGVALATAPAGQIGAVLGRGTTGDQLRYDVPKQTVVTTTTRVKRHGKWVKVTKKSNQTVQSPIIECGAGSPCDVVQQKITYPAGASSGWHSHPGMVFGVVISGTLTAYNPDCTKQTFSAGQTFVEMGSTHIRNVKNEGTIAADVLATLVVPAGTANTGLRIDQPQPSTCSA